MFNYLFEQHCKNSTILIASLALLTDELVKIDKPDFEDWLNLSTIINNLDSRYEKQLKQLQNKIGSKKY